MRNSFGFSYFRRKVICAFDLKVIEVKAGRTIGQHDRAHFLNDVCRSKMHLQLRKPGKDFWCEPFEVKIQCLANSDPSLRPESLCRNGTAQTFEFVKHAPCIPKTTEFSCDCCAHAWPNRPVTARQCLSDLKNRHVPVLHLISCPGPITMVTRARAEFELIIRRKRTSFERRFESFQTKAAPIGIFREKQRLDDSQSLLYRGMRARKI